MKTSSICLLSDSGVRISACEALFSYTYLINIAYVTVAFINSLLLPVNCSYLSPWPSPSVPPVLRSILPGKARGRGRETELCVFWESLGGDTEFGNAQTITQLYWHRRGWWKLCVPILQITFNFFSPQPQFNGGFTKYRASPQWGNYRNKFTQQFSCTFFVSPCFLPSFFSSSLLSSKWSRLRMFSYSIKRDKNYAGHVSPRSLIFQISNINICMLPLWVVPKCFDLI